jgi:hypothetical protein
MNASFMLASDADDLWDAIRIAHDQAQTSFHTTEFHDAAQLLIDAAASGWTGLEDVATEAVNLDLGRCGLSRCEHCGRVVADAALGDYDDETAWYTDSDGIGLFALCGECDEKAHAARKKIVVVDEPEETEIDDGNEFVCGGGISSEDTSALSDEEEELAGYLDRRDAGHARQSREIIHGYPRDERRDLHRYQDQIDAERSRAGKSHD